MTVGTRLLLVDEEGLYWFDIYMAEELVTRMPLRVLYQQIGTPSHQAKSRFQ